MKDQRWIIVRVTWFLAPKMRDTKVLRIVTYEAVALVCTAGIVVMVLLRLLSALLGQLTHQLLLLNMI
jgi:hypothetical protein